MASYTVRDCMLKNTQLSKRYITDLLYVFTQEANPFKVALDHTNRILEIYAAIGEKNEFVASWLTLMSYQPTNFETINVDTKNAKTNEEIFLMVCSKTKSQQKLIVFSHECWENYSYRTGKIIEFDGKAITVFDRDEAIIELNPKSSNTINAFSSMIATGQSTISDSKNKSHGE